MDEVHGDVGIDERLCGGAAHSLWSLADLVGVSGTKWHDHPMRNMRENTKVVHLTE